MSVVLLALTLGLFVWVLLNTLGTALTKATPDQSLVEDARLEEVAQLAIEKRDVLDAIKQVEADYETGKTSEADYTAFRQQSSTRAIGLMRRLDELRNGLKYGDRISEDLALGAALPGQPRLAGNPHSSAESVCLKCNARLAADDTFCSECGLQVAATCTECGSELRSGARFCRKCGVGVTLETEEPT